MVYNIDNERDGNPTIKPSYPVNAIGCGGIRHRKSGCPANILKGVYSMSTNEITAKVRKMKRLQAKADELNDEIKAIQDEIKAEMLTMGADELKAGEFKIRYAAVTSNRFDTASFKKMYAALYQQFTKPTTSRRFLVA